MTPKPAPAIFAAALALSACAAGAPPARQPAIDEEGTSLRLARAARAAGDDASAVNLYTTILQKNGANPLVTVELGDTLLDAGSIDDAMRTYRRAPSAPGAALGLERAYLRLGDVPKALQQADRALALAPDDAHVEIGRGIALDLAGRHGEAQAGYRAVLAKDPGNRAARVDLALSLAFVHKFDEATAIVTPIVRSSDATATERQDMALIDGLKGDDAAAREWSLLDLDPTATAGNVRFFDYVRGRVQ